MPATPVSGEHLMSSCMYALSPESTGLETGRRPVATVAARPRAASRSKKAPYRHVPHRDKPPQLVARRNARERRRVQAVNAAFVRLRQAVPGDAAVSRGKRVSKVKTLQRAIDYICLLQDLLRAEQNICVSNDLSQRRHDTRADFVSSARWSIDCKNEEEEEEEIDDEDTFEALLNNFENQF